MTEKTEPNHARLVLDLGERMLHTQKQAEFLAADIKKVLESDAELTEDVIQGLGDQILLLNSYMRPLNDVLKAGDVRYYESYRIRRETAMHDKALKDTE